MSPAEALARAVAVADLRVARQAALGPLGRWRLRRALGRAALELGLRLPAGEAAHVADADPVGATVALMQTAWLRLQGVVMAPTLNLREATQTRYYGELVRRRPDRLSTKYRVAIAAAGVALLATVVVLLVTSGGAERPPSLPAGPLAQLPAERQAKWVEAITDWVVALDRWSRGHHEGELSTRLDEYARNLALTRADVLGDDVRALFGEDAFGALAHMLDAAVTAADNGGGWAAREEAFAESVRATNRAFFARGLGYFFDSYAVRYGDGRAEAALYTFAIVARTQYLASGKPIDALHLRRLDSLNIVQSLLGYTSKRMDVAVLLVDKLEGEVATRLGPALAPARDMTLHTSAESPGDEPEALAEVRKKSGQVVREAYYAALPGEQQALSELGELLAKRSDLVSEWNQRLAHREVTLRDFDGLAVDAAYRERFEAVTSREARKALDDVQSRLERPEESELFLRLVARHARAVEVHEVQHRIDYNRGDDFEVPAALLEVIGVPADSDAADSEEVRRVAYELSAYTAELARDPEWARVNVTLVSEHLYDGSGGAEGWCAVMILEGLARELGVPFEPLLQHHNGADLERVARLHLALLSQDDHAIAKAAAALWEKWFGEPLVTLTRVP